MVFTVSQMTTQGVHLEHTVNTLSILSMIKTAKINNSTQIIPDYIKIWYIDYNLEVTSPYYNSKGVLTVPISFFNIPEEESDIVEYSPCSSPSHSHSPSPSPYPCDHVTHTCHNNDFCFCVGGPFNKYMDKRDYEGKLLVNTLLEENYESPPSTPFTLAPIPRVKQEASDYVEESPTPCYAGCPFSPTSFHNSKFCFCFGGPFDEYTFERDNKGNRLIDMPLVESYKSSPSTLSSPFILAPIPRK